MSLSDIHVAFVDSVVLVVSVVVKTIHRDKVCQAVTYLVNKKRCIKKNMMSSDTPLVCICV